MFQTIFRSLTPLRLRLGLSLLVFGIILLLLRALNVVWLFVLLPSLGLIFWGWWHKSSSWLMPGSILLGVALGMLLSSLSFSLGVLPQERRGGIFIFCCALGWFGVTILSRRFSEKTNPRDLAPKEPAPNSALWWAFIPGSLMVLLGFVATQADIIMILLTWLSLYWPFSLVALGLYIIFKP